ncbi:MAG: putative quinol monooxygenase [Pseudomonadota bacterium]
MTAKGIEGEIIVAGYVSFASGEIDRLQPQMQEVIAASRAEPGCLDYTYARLLEDPDTIRIFERWCDADALRNHFLNEPVVRWVMVLTKADVLSRDVSAHSVSGTHTLREFRDLPD